MSKELAEGRQIPINSATKKELRDFATHMGCTVTNFDDQAKIIAKLRAEGYEEAHIIALEPAAKKAAKGPAGGVSTKAPAPNGGVMEEPTVELTIHQQEGPGGKRAVFVGVNGKALLIPRNQSCRVKLRYFEALKNAIETKYEFDEDVKANTPRDLPSYPWQLHDMPSKAEQAAWHAYEAREEAKMRAREKAPVPTYDAAAAD